MTIIQKLEEKEAEWEDAALEVPYNDNIVSKLHEELINLESQAKQKGYALKNGEWVKK